MFLAYNDKAEHTTELKMIFIFGDVLKKQNKLKN